MATIVDALIVTLGLDAAAFKRGKSDATQATKKLTAEERRAAKEIEARNKKAAESFRAVRNEVLALLALFTAGLGIKEFTEQTIQGAIATGQLARDLGMVPGKLRATEQAFDRLGASTGDADEALKSIQEQAAKLKNGQLDDRLSAYLLNASRAGVTSASVRDVDDPMKKLERDAEIAQRLAQQQGRGFAILSLQAEGYSRSMADALMQGPAALQAEVQRQSKLNQLSQEETDRLRALDNRWKDFKEGLVTTGQRIVIALTPAFEVIVGLLDRLSNWFAAHADQIGQQVKQIADAFAAWVTGVDWTAVIAQVKAFFVQLDHLVQSLGGWKTVLAAIAALKVLSVVSPLMTLASAFTSLGSALGVLGTVGPAAIAVLASLGAAKALGLPSTDKSKGAQDIKNGDWLAASADLPAMDFIKALAHKAGGKSNDQIAAALGGAGRTAAAASTTTSGPVMSGSLADRQKYIAGRMKAAGYSDAQIAGVIGNLMQESTLNPDAENAGHRGIAQWDAQRQAQFQRQYGHTIANSTFAEQVDFMLWELKNTEKAAGDSVRASTSVRDATLAFSQGYERAGAGAMDNRRLLYANQIYAGIGQANAARIAQQTAGAPAALASQSNVSHSTSSTETNINGPFNIYTQATDAAGIARDFGTQMKNRLMLPQANTGLS